MRLLLLHVVRILAQDNEAFEDGRERNVLVGGELGALTVRQEHGRGVRLESGDGLGLAGLADDIDGLEQSREPIRTLPLTPERERRRLDVCLPDQRGR